jgi:type IV pilus assembly protein PilO
MNNYNISTNNKPSSSSSFSNLDLKDAHNWPLLPKWILLLCILAIPLAFGWYFYLSNKNETLDIEKMQELNLKSSFQDKYSQVQSLESLKEKKIIVSDQVKSLEGFLPSKTEMDKLLSDINQAGVTRNLSFDLFAPSAADIKEYYAKIAVNIKIKGKYHDIGLFLSDVAGLSRIVNLEKLKLTQVKNSEVVNLEGVMDTYRLLDEKEKKIQIDAKKAAANAENKGQIVNSPQQTKI